MVWLSYCKEQGVTRPAHHVAFKPTAWVELILLLTLVVILVVPVRVVLERGPGAGRDWECDRGGLSPVMGGPEIM